MSPFPAQNKRSILFVDDDAPFLQTLEALMRLWSKDKLEIHTAQSASAALAILQDQPVNLIVLDVCMPVVDGLQFLTVLQRRYPGVQKIVLTGYGTEAYRTACLTNGAELFLEKPRTSEGLETIFATIDELSRWQPETGFRGVLRRVGLLDVIQMECLGRTSSVLQVTTPEHTGAIYVKEGSIVHAETAQLKGEPALKQLLTLVSGEFRHAPYTDPPEHTITGSWEGLLMDAAQARDETLEKRAAEPPPPPVETVAEPASLPPPPLPEAVRIDELMICSEAGDVLHAWQCANTDLRISLLEFLSQKARLLHNVLPVGQFDRAEFSGDNQRLAAQIGNGRGVILRSSPAASAPEQNQESLNSRMRPSGRPSPEHKSRAQQWFQEHLSQAGLLAATLQFADRTGLTHSVSPKFPGDALENLRRSVNDTFQVLRLQKFRASRARWLYDQTAMETAQWSDGTALALVLSRQAFELNSTLIEEQMNDFLRQEPTVATD